MSRAWLGVVSAAHVRRGLKLGIAQVCHGKRDPLARMQPGDTLIYYSPTRERSDRAPYRHFTALGTIPDADIWQADESGFKPFRRRIDYLDTRAVPIDDLRDRLHLTSQPNWGYQLRFGLLPLDSQDAATIREAMSA